MSHQTQVLAHARTSEQRDAKQPAYQLLAALDLAVLQRTSAGMFRVTGIMPGWFQRLLPHRLRTFSPLCLSERFPILESFFPEAEKIWSSSEGGSVRSDFWSEPDPGGGEGHYRASALSASGQHFLILEVANEPYQRHQLMLQYVHETSCQDDQIQRLNRDLKIQSEKVESLLLNILPEGVAQELRAKGFVDPRYHEDVTIVFTDFKGFTVSTEELAAEDLVAALHSYFSAFDRISREYGLEKLKTIGDSYMCVAGMPVHASSHPVDAVLASFAMLEEVRKLEGTHQVSWQVRIGLHTGSVISGVVGTHKFAYDVWGDSVNLASRMESCGEANRINISAHTWHRVKDFFTCTARGKVLTKDKREYNMYFVEGALPSLMNGCAGGIPERFAQRYRSYFRRELKSFPASLLMPPSYQAEAV